jgi:hypothetical protein
LFLRNSSNKTSRKQSTNTSNASNTNDSGISSQQNSNLIKKSTPGQHQQHLKVLSMRDNNDQLAMSPDVDYIQMMVQREVSLTSPAFSEISDAQTTSEKYNFDAMTSSIEDTTTSISKKTSTRRTKPDEINNYQDEMNSSLLSNLPAKSINLK